MSYYEEDPRVNDIMLTIINDGDGSQCGGFDYAQRCAAGRSHDLFKFRWAAREYSRYAHRTYGTPHATREQTVLAGNLLLEYYQRHAEEL